MHTRTHTHPHMQMHTHTHTQVHTHTLKHQVGIFVLYEYVHGTPPWP